MKVTLEDGGPCRKVIHIHAPAETVHPEYDKVVAEFAKVARVDGFRVGKAPQAIVARNFTRAIAEETRERLIPRLYRDALKQEAITPVSIVSVDNVALSPNEGLRFKVVVDIPPEFKLPKYRKVPLKENPVEVTDSAVDEAYKRLMDRFARFEEVADRPAREGDLVMVDYRGECEGKPLAEVAPEAAGLGEGKDFWVMLGEPEFLPGFVKGLQGAAIGETRAIKVEFPAGFRVSSMQGKTADYTVQIKAIREKIAPVVDAEFFKRFEVDSDAALKAKLRQQLIEAAEQTEKNRQKSDLVKFLLENTELDVPQSVVDEETDLTIRSTVRRIAMEGGSREQIREMRESIVSSAARTATERVKVSYILSRIADEEKIEVAEAEMDERVEAMAKDYGMTPEKMRAELEKRNGMEALKSDLRAEKTLDTILASARVKK